MSKRARQDSTSTSNDVSLSPQASDALSEGKIVHTPKYTGLDSTVTSSAMQCMLPPHKPLSFATYAEHEAHYQQVHANRCMECKKNFPTAYFLELHISENHDPIVGARRDKGEKTLACFVEGCDKVCADWKKRRSHLVDKHGFPKNYDFFVVDAGVDGRRSMLRPGVDAQGHRKSSRERRASSGTEVTESKEATSVSKEDEIETEGNEGEGSSFKASRPAANTAMAGSAVDELISSMSSLGMVPRSVKFGRGKGRAGFAKS